MNVSSARVSAVDAIADQVKSARVRGAALRIAGAGGWMSAGRPARAQERLELSAHAGIVDYVPGDLTLTARAGTRLSEIARVTAEHGQWLTLDPHGSPEGTIGATVATASAGPLASAFGGPRDHVLGCEFVSGTGDVVRAGGRVVKNVAGFDLVRLTTGAWGSLGAITEVSVRLRARPEVDVSMVVNAGGRPAASVAGAAAAWLRTTHLTPLCAELVSPACARAVGHEDAALLLRFGGNSAYARAATDDAAALGNLDVVPSGIWSRLAVAEGEDACVFRVSTLPSLLPALWERASELAESMGGWAHSTVARGVVRCVLPLASVQLDVLRARLAPLLTDNTAIGERVPAELWPVFTRVRDSDPLRAGVKRAFDPDGVMNPGILGTT